MRVISGPYEDRYGQVKSINGDMGRITLKWALGSDGPPQEVMEGFVELVTKKQHDEVGRDISRKTKAAKEHARKKEEEAKEQQAATSSSRWRTSRSPAAAPATTQVKEEDQPDKPKRTGKEEPQQPAPKSAPAQLRKVGKCFKKNGGARRAHS